MIYKCEICEENFSCENSFKQHLLSNMHKKIIAGKRSIFVNIPQSTTIVDLIRFFSQYGAIIKYECTKSKRHLIIEFQDQKIAQTLISKKEKVFMKDIKLNLYQIKDYNYKEVGERQLSYNNISKAFTNTTFDSQLTAFLNAILLTDTDIRLHYEPVCKAMDSIFIPIFPKFKSYRFGSTTTGLAFKNCDLDIYLNIGLPVTDQDSKPIGPHIISMKNLFPVIENILRKHSNIFSKLISIPSAKIPIIKFTYLETNVNCDISFKNDLAVYNSELVKFYISIDPRFQQLMAIIKYWIICCELRKRVGITKYALTILFIFYLQQLNLVPSVNDLKKKCAIPVIVKGWQINFNKSLAGFQVNNYNKSKTIPELLQRFFQFYAKYDFRNNVVCPCDGKSYNKELFENPDAKNLPISVTKYEEYLVNTKNAFALSTWKPMCVQDPNELNTNLTGSIGSINLERFQIYCSIAENIIINSEENNFQDMLKNLFNFTDTS